MSVPDPVAQQSILASPLPTKATLKHRRNLFYQVIRLAAINIKMFRVIATGRHL
ncbi:MAG: hypothetical protein FWF25_05390 [Propionibacteriaceae bacterium]|nr:hypothetical protein [Propionibacteriaceae bacterium]